MTRDSDMTAADMLAAVRPRYEAEGFHFVTHPSDEVLPDFLRGRRLDAIAFKDPGGTVIEVKKRDAFANTGGPSGLAERIAAEKDWTLSVLYMRGRPGKVEDIPAPNRSQIDGMLEEVEALAASGWDRAAFLSCWILLEALTRFVDRMEEARFGRVLTPFQIVQRLASSGYVEPEPFAKFRRSADLRNRLAHGDLDAAPMPADLQLLIGTARRVRDEIYSDEQS